MRPTGLNCDKSLSDLSTASGRSFMRPRDLVLVTILLCCAAACSAKAPDPAMGQTRPAGVSGPINSEAERAYAEAAALRSRPAASASAFAVCSNPAEAVRKLDKAVALEPKFARAYALRGLIESETGQKEKAFEDLTVAVRLEPTAEHYASRALVSLRQGQIKAAERDLDYALKLDAASDKAHNYFGVLHLSLDDRTAACVNFRDGCKHGDCAFLEAARKEKICP
jgi:tetratricopeptide (TPR) repeat protein